MHTLTETRLSEPGRLRFGPPAVLAALLLLPCAAWVDGPSADQRLQGVFAELRELRPMAAGREYTGRVSGRDETGPKELFLRRRTAQEVNESGLSCGCGDYARVFIARVVHLGFDPLLVDGAEISSASLQDHVSGHSVVAIRVRGSPADAPWWLVESTHLRLLVRAWSPGARSFEAFDTVFWIGYCGPLADYPVHDAGELRSFCARTLAAVPREVLERNLCQLDYTIDPSLVGTDGAPLNPRLPRFLRLQAGILADLGVRPLRRVPALLTRGEDDSTTNLKYSKAGGWISHVGLKSGCSPSLLSYFEQTIRGQCGPVFY